MSEGQDSTWEHFTERACHQLRMQWSEHGVDYLYPDLPNDALRVPDRGGPRPGPSGKPHPGSPVYDTMKKKPDDDFAQWHEIDRQLVQLFYHDFRSGQLEKARDAFDALGHAPLGMPLQGSTLEEPDGGQLGDDATDHLENLETGLRDWHGTACEQYLRHNVDLKRALAGCQDRITAAWRLMGEYRRAVRHMRYDVKELVDKANKSFEDIGNTDESVELTALQTIVSTAVAGLSIPIAGGGAAVAVALAGVTGALASGGIAEKVLTVDADKPGGVVHNVVKGGWRIVEQAREIEKRLQGACHSLIEHLSPPFLDVTTSNRNGVRAARPDIVAEDRFNPGQFRPGGWSDADVGGIGHGDLIPGHQSRRAGP